MTSSFVQRRIDVTFQLGEGDFGEGGFNTVKLKGLRVSCNLVKNGSVGMGTGHIRIWGMKLSTMNKLATLGNVPNAIRRNLISVDAGDDVSGMTSVFKAVINDAFIDINAAPDACFNVVGTEGSFEAFKPVTPTTFKGDTDVATLIQTIAKKAGLTFENNNVDVKLSNPYCPGTARQQMYEIAEAAHINIIIDKGVVAIWPKGKSRGDKIWLITPDTGLKGYPAWTSNGIQIKTLFLPFIEFGVAFELKSQLLPANKVWVIQRLQFNLDSENPGGPWETIIDANEPDVAAGRLQRP